MEKCQSLPRLTRFVLSLIDDSHGSKGVMRDHRKKKSSSCSRLQRVVSSIGILILGIYRRESNSFVGVCPTHCSELQNRDGA